MSIVKQQRRKKKMSQQKVADLVGITRQYYNEIELDKRKPSINVAKKIAAVLGIEWTIFFMEEVNI